MNNKICTSIEQSKKLIELGVDINTADLTVTNYLLQDGSRFDFICCKLPNDTFPSITDGKSERIPAWSLEALLRLIWIEQCLHGYLTEDGMVYRMETLYAGNSRMYDNPIDACVDMIEKLYEQELL